MSYMEVPFQQEFLEVGASLGQVKNVDALFATSDDVQLLRLVTEEVTDELKLLGVLHRVRNLGSSLECIDIKYRAVKHGDVNRAPPELWRLGEALEPLRYSTDDVNEEVVAVVVDPWRLVLVATDSGVRHRWTPDLRRGSHLDDLHEDFVGKRLHCHGDFFPRESGLEGFKFVSQLRTD